MLQLPSITDEAAIAHLQRLGRVYQVAIDVELDEAQPATRVRVQLTAGVWWPGGRENLFDHFADHADRYGNPWGMLLKTCIRSPMNGQAIGGWVATVREPFAHGVRLTFYKICGKCGQIPPPPGIPAGPSKPPCPVCNP